MGDPKRSSVALLAVAGMLSPVLTVYKMMDTSYFLVSGGIVFGVVLAVYFALYEGYWSPVKLGLFICACAAAYPVAQCAAIRSIVFFNDVTTAQDQGVPIPTLFVGGGVGAFLVFMAALLLFASQKMNVLLFNRVCLWSIGGGGLGLIGGVANHNFVHRPNNLPAVYWVWQPGTALLLGIMLAQERSMPIFQTNGPLDADAFQQKENGRNGIAIVLLIACVLSFCGIALFRMIR